MKILEKTVTLGEMTFKVGTDREIAVKTFDKYPDLLEYMFDRQEMVESGGKSFIRETLKNGELGQLLDMENKFADLIGFALPLMLKKANDDTDAQKIIDYAKENGADTVMNSALLEFLCEGFTQSEPVKPKIKFAMK